MVRDPLHFLLRAKKMNFPKWSSQSGEDGDADTDT